MSQKGSFFVLTIDKIAFLCYYIPFFYNSCFTDKWQKQAKIWLFPAACRP